MNPEEHHAQSLARPSRSGAKEVRAGAEPLDVLVMEVHARVLRRVPRAPQLLPNARCVSTQSGHGGSICSACGVSWCFSRSTQTGHVAPRTTASATEPMTQRASPRLPCVPTTIVSASMFAAVCRIAWGAGSWTRCPNDGHSGGRTRLARPLVEEVRVRRDNQVVRLRAVRLLPDGGAWVNRVHDVQLGAASIPIPCGRASSPDAGRNTR